MRRLLINSIKALAVCVAAGVQCAAAAAETQHVVLQLKWDHQFQFAGYYAALWEGYYEEAGLDVEVRSRVQPDGSLCNVMQELEEGRADFAVASSDILGARGRGTEVVILSSIFQRSPYALVSLEKVPINKPSDLRGKRLSYQTGTFSSLELDALLRTHRIGENEITKVPFRPGVDALLAGDFDVTMDYPSAALWRARELGININLLYPSAFDLPFYGDTLCTHQRLINKDADLARRFRDASIRGWRYAMDHPEEICRGIEQRLSRSLPCNDFPGFLRFEADMVRAWMRYPEVEVGSTNSWRWASTYRQMARAGVIEDKGSIGGFVLDAAQSPTSDTPRYLSFALFLVGMALAIGLLVLFLFTSVRHWALPLFAAGIMLLAIYLVDRAQHETRVQQQRLEISTRISALRAKLESAILSDVQTLHGLAAYVRQKPEFTQAEFEAFCRDLTDLNARIRCISAAPDLVVKYVYPMANNEEILGLNYRTHPSQTKAALRSVELRREVVAGPIELVQGGRGLVIRMPVFTGAGTDEQLWGVVGISIDFDLLIASTGWAALNQEFDIAVRGQDGLGTQGDVFFGDGALFDGAPVLQEVVFPSGSWLVAGAPKGGWGGTKAPNWNIWAVGLLTLSLVLLMLVFRERQVREQAETTLRLRDMEATRARAQALAKVSTLRHDFVEQRITLSPEFCEMLAMPAVETSISEEEFLSFVRPADHERLIKLNKLARTAGKKLSFDVELLGKDGKARHVHLHSEIVQDKAGKPVGAFETVQDITERYEVQEALRKSEERFSLAMLGSNDSLFDSDRRTGKVYYSPRFREMFGLDPNLHGDSPEFGLGLIHPEDKQRVYDEFSSVIASRSENIEMEFRMLTADGRTMDVLTRAHIARDEAGQAVRVVGTIADVTPLKNAERETRQLHAQLQQAQKMEAIGHLAGGIAHDFNNILASILGFNELAVNGIRSGASAERLERYLREVELSGLRARDLVRQLLSFSRPGSGGLQAIAIASVVRDTLKMLRAMMPSTIAFDAEVADKQPYVMANPVQLNQVLLNLIINARDAMGESGTIGVRVDRYHAEGLVCDSCHQGFDGEYVTVSVEDTGCGIRPEQRERLFEPFYTTKEPGKGTGMGLAVVHGTLHSMGAHLTVESEPGEGTVITLYLPHVAAETREKSPQPEPNEGTLRHGGRILLAEDEEAVAAFLSEALGQSGYEVSRCANGAQAWQRFREQPNHFDLLLTDQAMPEMSGSTLSEKILKQRPGFPIILISGYSETVNEAVAADIGISQFLAKPVRLNVLLETVARLISTRAESAAAVE